jgi:hypothetical protein
MATAAFTTTCTINTQAVVTAFTTHESFTSPASTSSSSTSTSTSTLSLIDQYDAFILGTYVNVLVLYTAFTVQYSNRDREKRRKEAESILILKRTGNLATVRYRSTAAGESERKRERKMLLTFLVPRSGPSAKMLLKWNSKAAKIYERVIFNSSLSLSLSIYLSPPIIYPYLLPVQ